MNYYPAKKGMAEIYNCHVDGLTSKNLPDGVQDVLMIVYFDLLIMIYQSTTAYEKNHFTPVFPLRRMDGGVGAIAERQYCS